MGEYSPYTQTPQLTPQLTPQHRFFKRNVLFYLLPYPTILRPTPIIPENPFNRLLNTR
nr:MAG TPA: hypothetical protein [Caudoviricetes sp.]